MGSANSDFDVVAAAAAVAAGIDAEHMDLLQVVVDGHQRWRWRCCARTDVAGSEMEVDVHTHSALAAEPGGRDAMAGHCFAQGAQQNC